MALHRDGTAGVCMGQRRQGVGRGMLGQGGERG